MTDKPATGMETLPVRKKDAQSNGVDVYSLFDREDDKMIVAELKGQVLDACVYEYTGADRKSVRGLSKKGVGECTRELAKKGEVLRIKSYDWRQDGEYAYFTVVGQRVAVNQHGQEVVLDESLGTKRQWTKMKINIYEKGQRTGEHRIVPDPFWYEKGYAKAARNANIGLLPESLKEEMIEAGIAAKRVLKVEKPSPRQRQTAKPQPQDALSEIDALRKEIAEKMLFVCGGDTKEASAKLKEYMAVAGREIPAKCLLKYLKLADLNSIKPHVDEDYKKKEGGDASQ